MYYSVVLHGCSELPEEDQAQLVARFRNALERYLPEERNIPVFVAAYERANDCSGKAVSVGDREAAFFYQAAHHLSERYAFQGRIPPKTVRFEVRIAH